MGFIQKIMNPVASIAQGAVDQKTAADQAEQNRINFINARQTRQPMVQENYSGVVGGNFDVDPATGQPLMKYFQSNIDQNTGLLKSPYNLRNNVDQRGLNALREEALRPQGELSKWGQMALSQAANQGAAQAASQTQQARNQLASQGGLRSGARERLAAQGMQGQLMAGQNALGNVQMQDEQTRQKWLSQLPGQELAMNQYNSDLQNKNIERALGEIGNQRDFEKARYTGDLTSWAATKSSDALKASAIAKNSGLCYLTTACCEAMGKPDNFWVLEEARKFRDEYMSETPELCAEVIEYYKVAPSIVEAINKKEDSKKIWKKLFWSHFVPFSILVKNKKESEAYKVYKEILVKTKQLSEVL